MGVALQVASSTCVYSWRSSWSGNRSLETLRKLPSREYTAEFLNSGGVVMCTSRKGEIAKSRLPQIDQPLYSFNYFNFSLVAWWNGGNCAKQGKKPMTSLSGKKITNWARYQNTVCFGNTWKLVILSSRYIALEKWEIRLIIFQHTAKLFK